MAGQDITAGRAYVELALRNNLTKGLLAAKQHLQSFGAGAMKLGAGMTGLGAAITAPFVGAVKHFMETGGALDDISQRTGVASSRLAELGYAAEMSGAGMEDVEKALINMAKKGMSVDDFGRMAAEIAAIEDPSKKAAKAFEVFGKSGVNLIPMLGDLDKLAGDAHKLGIIPDDADVAAAASLGDVFDDIFKVFKSIVFNVGAALAPVLQPALETVRNIAVTVGDWVKNNGDLIRTVAQVGAGIIAAGAAITAIGATIFGAGAAFGAVATVLGTIGSAVATILPFLSAIGVAAAAAAGAFYLFGDTIKSAFKSVYDSAVKFLTPIVDFAKKVFGGIYDAISNGDLQSAATIAMNGVMVAFGEAKLRILNIWLDVKEYIFRTWDQIGVHVSGAAAFVGSLIGSVGEMFMTHWGPRFKQISEGWTLFQESAGAAIKYIVQILQPLNDALLAVGKSLLGIIMQADEAAKNTVAAGVRAYDKALGEANGISPSEALDKALAARTKAMAGASNDAEDNRIRREGDAAVSYAKAFNDLQQAKAELDSSIANIKRGTGVTAGRAPGRSEVDYKLPDKEAFEQMKAGPVWGTFSAQAAFGGAALGQGGISETWKKMLSEQQKTNRLLQDANDLEAENVFVP